MSTELATTDAIESALISGDLKTLSASARLGYYRKVCESLGLNPFTRPFDYVNLNGKLTLYPKRDAADQLRRVRGISVEIVSRTVDDGILTVHVRAIDKDGRKDEDFGVVAITGLKGVDLANATLKAVTKAKRRVTLSLAGLGWLDETEVETIPSASYVQAETVIEPELAVNGWPEKIAGCPDLEALTALRTEIRAAYGSKVPRHVADAWRAREAEIKAVA